MPKFKMGDIVVLKTGEAPQRVIDVRLAGSYALRTQYLNDPEDHYGTTRRWRAADDFKPYEADEPATETKTMADLYQTKNEPVEFGTLLTRNSTGKLVLEMKGSGDVKVFDAADVEVVRPYTVRVKNAVGQPIHKIAVKGSVVIGDLILHDGVVFEVEALDTKCTKPQGHLKGRKLITEPLAVNETEE